jgi:hypothetical protein
MAFTLLHGDQKEDDVRAFSSLNTSVMLGVTYDAEIAAADTVAVLASDMVAGLKTGGIRVHQDELFALQRASKGLLEAKAVGVCVDTDVASLTDVAGLRTVFTAANDAIPSSTFQADQYSE